MRRIFIALPLPENVKTEVIALMGKLQKFSWPITWEVPGKLHVTLRFLGSISDAQLRVIESVVADVAKATAPLMLRVDGYVAFPDFTFPRVLGLKIVDHEGLLALQSAISSQVGALNIGQPEDRQFTGHVTLGRFKKSHVNLRALKMLPFKASFPVTSVDIMESVSKPLGSEYTIIRSYSLG